MGSSEEWEWVLGCCHSSVDTLPTDLALTPFAWYISIRTLA
jgi:hypothetical protein